MAELTMHARRLTARTANLALNPKTADRIMAVVAVACLVGTATARAVGWLS